MKLKSSVKYYLHSLKPAVIIFYIVMLSLSIISLILSMTLSGDSRFGGIAASSIIFLFIMGICSFTQEFRMFIQNGLTRNELWRSFIISGLILSAIMSAIDLAVLGILSLFMEVGSLVMTISSAYVSNTILNIIISYFLQVLFYTLALATGYLIRLIYHCLNKFFKVVVSIAVPAFFFIALPLFSHAYDLHPFRTISNAFAYIVSPDKFYGLPMLYISFTVITTVIALIDKLLIRKAIMK